MDYRTKTLEILIEEFKTALRNSMIHKGRLIGNMVQMNDTTKQLLASNIHLIERIIALEEKVQKLEQSCATDNVEECECVKVEEIVEQNQSEEETLVIPDFESEEFANVGELGEDINFIEEEKAEVEDKDASIKQASDLVYKLRKDREGK